MPDSDGRGKCYSPKMYIATEVDPCSNKKITNEKQRIETKKNLF